jgi:hypothetical protein
VADDGGSRRHFGFGHTEEEDDDHDERLPSDESRRGVGCRADGEAVVLKWRSGKRVLLLPGRTSDTLLYNCLFPPS